MDVMRYFTIILLLILTLLTAATPPPPYIYYFPVIFKNPPPPPKKGVATYAYTPGCVDAPALNADWWYNWWAVPSHNCSLVDFVPMLYKASVFDANKDFLLMYSQDSRWVLGYNEPNLVGQGDTTPLAGAVTWRRLEELVEGTDIKLVSPAPNQFPPGYADPYGYTWLLAMVREYERLYGTRPRFDAIAWHYYGSVSQTKAYLVARHNDFAQMYPGVPIWLTEFNPCLTNSQSYSSFMADMLPWLEAQPWIGRYAWFINRPTPDFPETYSPCTLLDVSGNPTVAGELYRGY